MRHPSKVSVVIPTYNRCIYLVEAINSVLSQSYKNIEIIIVDDASTDQTQDVLKLFSKNKNIKFFKNPKNLGQARSLNFGWKKSNGDFIMYLSSDDFLEVDAISELVRFIASSNFDIVYASYNIVDDLGDVVKVVNPLNFKKSILTENLVCLPGPATIMRASVFNKLRGWNPELTFYGDLNFWIQASDYFSFAKLDQVLSNYRIHKNSGLSSNKSIKAIDQIFDIVNNYWRMKQNNEGSLRKATIHAHLLSVRHLLLSGKSFKCFPRLGNLFFKYPTCFRYSETYKVSLLWALQFIKDLAKL